MTHKETRKAHIKRETKETQIEASLCLEGTGVANVQTGIPFLDHMLDQLARHGGLDITLRAQGDLEIDGHHTAEDCGIVLGRALNEALGERAGIVRFGSALAPLDEALSEAVIDCAGRFHFEWRVSLPSPRLGDADSEIFREFFKAFAEHGRLTLHIHNRYGVNAHHIIESCFKACALALRTACQRDGSARIPSTKGVIDKD